MFTIHSSSRFIGACLLVMMLVGSLAAPQAAHAATLTVNTLLDENDGSCSDGDCSLRDAIQVATAGDTITFSVTGTIVLILGQLTVGKDLTLNGPGQDSLTVSGNNSSRVFYITAGNVVLSNLTISDGHANSGGGLFTEWSNLTLTGVIISNNIADNGSGGGIYQYSGDITLINVTFNNNSASSDYYVAIGGGMYIESLGNSTLTHVSFSGNSAYVGGGLYNSRENNITLTNVTFSGNSATEGGGMYNYTNDIVTLTDVTFNGNSASYGGGMHNLFCDCRLTNVTFNNNSASAGGGMFIWFGSPILRNVTFSNNSASAGGGMHNIASESQLINVSFSNNTATSYGGGMYNGIDSSPVLTNVTISDNSAPFGGGVYNSEGSYPTLANVTISGNSATNGGGIYSSEGSYPTLTNVTISGNSASAIGGGVYGYFGSGLILKNTLIAGNTASTAGPDCSGTVTSFGYNLIQNIDGCTIEGDETGNIYGEDPLLGPLQDNGGATFTHALLPGSPAIDAADFTDPYGNPVTEDQRGVARPQGPANDIGAYEAEIMGNTMHVHDITLRVRGTRLTGTVTVYDQDSLPVEGANVTVEVSGPLPPRSLTRSTNVNGQARFAGPARSGTWTLCVTDIFKDGYTYDQSQNVETCDTIVIP